MHAAHTRNVHHRHSAAVPCTPHAAQTRHWAAHFSLPMPSQTHCKASLATGSIIVVARLLGMVHAMFPGAISAMSSTIQKCLASHPAPSDVVAPPALTLQHFGWMDIVGLDQLIKLLLRPLCTRTTTCRRVLLFNCWLCFGTGCWIFFALRSCSFCWRIALSRPCSGGHAIGAARNRLVEGLSVEELGHPPCHVSVSGGMGPIMGLVLCGL